LERSNKRFLVAYLLAKIDDNVDEGEVRFFNHVKKAWEMIENLSHYWDKADGKPKRRFLVASLLKNSKISILRVATTFSLQKLSLLCWPARF
jgi:hypothetical protein